MDTKLSYLERLEAVRQVKEEGKSMRSVAIAFGIQDRTISNWVKNGIPPIEFKCKRCGVDFCYVKDVPRVLLYCSDICKDRDWKDKNRVEITEKGRLRKQKEMADPIKRARANKQNAEWVRKNKSKKNKWVLDRHHRKYKTDLQYTIDHRISARVASLFRTIKDGKIVKKSKSLDYIGCDAKFLKNHTESQFSENMNWKTDNWDIDHIRPVSSFDLTDEKQIFVCLNWRNLQPLDSVENRIVKRDSYTKKDEILWAKRMRDLGYEGELFLKYQTYH